MNPQFDDVAEVVSTSSAKKANAYLAHGYKLSGTYQSAQARDRKDGPSYVRKGVDFVLCRPSDVAAFDVDASDEPVTGAEG
jgi:hypothetical protein